MGKKIKYINVNITSVVKLAKGEGDIETADVSMLASTADTDRDGEVIKQEGWDLKEFLTNPVIMFAHNYSDLPIGKAVRVALTDKGLEMDIKFASEKGNPKGQQVKTLIEEGILNAGSVGFIPQERNPEDESIIEKAQLLEFSIVPVPANPNALVLAAQKGIDPDIFLQRDVVAPHTPPTATKDMAWEVVEAVTRLRNWAGGPQKEDIDFGKYKDGFAWFDEENLGEFESYKLLHHDIVDGEFNVVWRGVVAAMQVLLGARGGVDVPEAARRGVYNHLARHYGQFDEEPPEFKAYTKEELDLIDKGGHVKPKPRKPRKQELPEDTTVQTLIMSKERFETLEEARSWVTDNDFSADKVDETENSFRFRQIAPGACQEESFRTIELTEGVSAVICRPTKSGGKCNIKITVEKYDVEKNIGPLVARVIGRTESQDPQGKHGKGSHKGGEVTVVLPMLMVEELRQRTLQAYKRNEDVLAITKRIQDVLHKNIYEQKPKTY